MWKVVRTRTPQIWTQNVTFDLQLRFLKSKASISSSGIAIILQRMCRARFGHYKIPPLPDVAFTHIPSHSVQADSAVVSWND